VNNNWIQKVGVWLIVGLVLFTVFKQFDKPRTPDNITYTQFMDDAKSGKIKRVDVQGRNIMVTPNEGQKYTVISPGDIRMVGDLMKYGVQVTGKAEEEQSLLVSALYYLGPTLLIIGFWFLMMRQMQGGGKGGAFSFGKSRARLMMKITTLSHSPMLLVVMKPRKKSASWSIFCVTPLSFKSSAVAYRVAC